MMNHLINICTIYVLCFSIEAAVATDASQKNHHYNIKKNHVISQNRASATIQKRITKKDKHDSKAPHCWKWAQYEIEKLFEKDGYYDDDWYNDCRDYWRSISPTKSHAPSQSPRPSTVPSQVPSSAPTKSRPPSLQPSQVPSSAPTKSRPPSTVPSQVPSSSPTKSRPPSQEPSYLSSIVPTSKPSHLSSYHPSTFPSMEPSDVPSDAPSLHLSIEPTLHPSGSPSLLPSVESSIVPTSVPSLQPSELSSMSPSKTSAPSAAPSHTQVPTNKPLHDGQLYYEIDTFDIILHFEEDNFMKRNLNSRNNRDFNNSAELVNENELLTVIIVALSAKYLEKILYFDSVDLTLTKEETVMTKSYSGAKQTKLTYSCSGYVILNTSSWHGDINASQIPSKSELWKITLDAFSALKTNMSYIVENKGNTVKSATHQSLQSWDVKLKAPRSSSGSSSDQNSDTTVQELGNGTSTIFITLSSSIIAIVSTITAFGLLYRQTRINEQDGDIDETPKKRSDVSGNDTTGAVDESGAMIIKSNSTRKFRSPFMTVSPPDGTKKYFSKLDDDSVYSSSHNKYGKVINPNQSMVDSSFDESSYADSLRAPSLVGSKGTIGDVESLAGMSALDNVRLNSVLQIDEGGGFEDDDRSLVSNDTGVFRRIWYGNKRASRMNTSRMNASRMNTSSSGNGSVSMRKLSPPSKDTPTKKSPTKSTSTRKSPNKSTPSKRSPSSSSKNGSPYTSISKSPLEADDNEKKKSAIDDASLLDDASTKSEYYGQNMKDETLFYNMLGDKPNRSFNCNENGNGNDDDGDDSSEDINFTEMYNGDGYSENTSVSGSIQSAGMSRTSTSKLSSVAGSLIVGEYEA